MRHEDLENAAQYLMLFAGLLLGASLLGMAMAIIKLGLTFLGVTNPL